MERTIRHWQEYSEKAFRDGFYGLRVSCVESWTNLAKANQILDYKKMLHNYIRNGRVILLCSYLLEEHDAATFLAITYKCEKVLVKMEGSWQDIHIQKRLRDDQSTSEELESLVRERTNNLNFSMERMEKELADRNRTERRLIQTRDELTRRNADLQQFAYIISHNLRSPITNILGIAMLFNEATAGEEQEILRRTLLTAIHEMDKVVQDLGHIVQVRLSDEAREEVDLKDIVTTVLHVLAEDIRSTNARVDYDFSHVQQLNSIRPFLFSIFINLISNSIKYRHRDRSPEMLIKSHAQDGKVHILFTDNGYGIDLEKYGSRMFKLYQRFTSEREGRGLGLFLVKSQAEALGGSISVSSVPGSGTTFILELPLD